MDTALGFTAIWAGTEKQLARAKAAQARALSHFPALNNIEIELGETRISLWGRGSLKDCTCVLPDGSLLALIGSPLGSMTLESVGQALQNMPEPGCFALPYDGRAILAWFSKDGRQWKLWNDWLGSIPVYHTHNPVFRAASTLEPVVVAANNFSRSDIFLPSLVFLMSHGHYLGKYTLFQGMEFAPPDSEMEWTEAGFRHTPLNTISGSDMLWEAGYNVLLEQMHGLAQKAIRSALKTQPFWILPLSGGLDSRMIACVASESKTNLTAYTWGPETTRDGIFAKQIARTLKIPWKRIHFQTDYLEQYAREWADLFGSAMHFHGMYHLSFLENIKNEPAGKIASGFLGDSIHWASADEYFFLHSLDDRGYQVSEDGFLLWGQEEIQAALKFPVSPLLDQIAGEIQATMNGLKGAFFQRIMLLNLWERQRHFTYFQSMMSDYYRGVATPYLNKEYARFCFSLPRPLVENRRLFIDMMQRHYAEIMCIPGTYARDPAQLTGRYLLRRRAAEKLPKTIARRAFPEFFAPKGLQFDVTSIQKGGKAAVWPIYEASSQLKDWVNYAEVDRVYQNALAGNFLSVRKLQCLQALAYRVMEIG